MDATLLATSDLEGEGDWVEADGGNGCFTAMMDQFKVQV